MHRVEVYRIPALKAEGELLPTPEPLFGYEPPLDIIIGHSRIHPWGSMCRRLVLCTRLGSTEILFHPNEPPVVKTLFRPEDSLRFSAGRYNVGSSKVVGLRSFNLIIYKNPSRQSSPIKCMVRGGDEFASTLMDETSGRIVFYGDRRKVVSVLEA